MTKLEKTYPKIRNLDTCYFMAERNGEFESLSFTDLTKEEQNKVIENWDVIALKRMVLFLADTLRAVGDVLNMFGEGAEDEE